MKAVLKMSCMSSVLIIFSYLAPTEKKLCFEIKEKTKTQDKLFLESLLNLIALLIIIDVFV